MSITKGGYKMIMKLLRYNKNKNNLENLFGADFAQNTRSKR